MQNLAMPATIVFQGPMDLSGYDRSLTNDKQPHSIPGPFLDAMLVREGVFVKEQGVPLRMEADPDDARSCHFIAYVGSKPAGTLRLVPFPHDPHPLPGSSWDITEDADVGPLLTSPVPKFILDRATSAHDGREAYVKLGRWAVLKEFRGQGIAKQLVDRALQWVQDNPAFFNQHVSGVDEEHTVWRGLVCVHAQEHVSQGWEKMGFVVDEGMGEWTEATIPHVGMWRRLDIANSKSSS